MKLTPQIVLEVASHEGLCREAYLDIGGTWTWSIGLTNAAYPDGVEKFKDRPMSRIFCLSAFIEALERLYVPAVGKAFNGYELTEEQFAAALSFHWNTGKIGQATWVKRYREGKDSAAKKTIMNWVNVGGKFSQSLADRRAKERDLFFEGKWSNDGTVLEYQVNKSHMPVKPKRVDIHEEVETLFNMQGNHDQPPLNEPDLDDVIGRNADKRWEDSASELPADEPEPILVPEPQPEPKPRQCEECGQDMDYLGMCTNPRCANNPDSLPHHMDEYAPSWWTVKEVWLGAVIVTIAGVLIWMVM